MSHSTDRQVVRIETLENYFKEFHQARKQLDKYPGLWRYLGTVKFNTEFFNKSFYKRFTPSRNFLQCEQEDNKYEDKQILDDILSFCMTTDVCNLLGMSVADFLELDLITYRQIRDKYDEMDEPRKKALREMQQQIRSPQASRQSYDDIKEQMVHERRNGLSRNW